MLTRFKVSGFKNLVDVDVRFGPFTCIAGANAVGKSNLFDAIRFFGYLADDTLMNAALAVRAEEGRTGDIRDLFHRSGNQYDDRMTFEAEMIIPAEGIDDLGQHAKATITFVRYRLELGYRIDYTMPSVGSLELLSEDLEQINLGDAPKHLRFRHNAGAWRKSVIKGRRTSPFIATSAEGDNRVIKLSQDGVQGRPKSLLAKNLPRTVLSTVNAAESPTALLARRELQSWRLLQLEPSALRQPDRFTTAPGLSADGAHLPATLDYLARTIHTNGHTNGNTYIYDQIAARLAELIDDVYEITVDRDQVRELLTLQVTDQSGTVYPARSLSDGTLRFLALAVLNLDPETGGLICMEEPENGIHPERIPAILQLLQDIACDVESPVGYDNPLRQVIVNTHSPAVVNQVPDESLLIASTKEIIRDGQRFRGASFSWLPDTWRSEAEPEIPPVAKGELLSYLNPTGASIAETAEDEKRARHAQGGQSARRVMDRSDLQLELFPRVGNQHSG